MQRLRRLVCCLLKTCVKINKCLFLQVAPVKAPFTFTSTTAKGCWFSLHFLFRSKLNCCLSKSLSLHAVSSLEEELGGWLNFWDEKPKVLTSMHWKDPTKFTSKNKCCLAQIRFFFNGFLVLAISVRNETTSHWTILSDHTKIQNLHPSKNLYTLPFLATCAKNQLCGGHFQPTDMTHAKNWLQDCSWRDVTEISVPNFAKCFQCSPGNSESLLTCRQAQQKQAISPRMRSKRKTLWILQPGFDFTTWRDQLGSYLLSPTQQQLTTPLS